MSFKIITFVVLVLAPTACKDRPEAPNYSKSSRDSTVGKPAVPEPTPLGEPPIGEEPIIGDEPMAGTEPMEGEPPVDGEPEDPNKKLEIKVSGRQLLVDGKPFHMKGVCYSPVAKGKELSQGPLFANPNANDLKAIEKDFQMMKDAGINTIRTYNVIENDKVLSLLNKYGIFVIVPVISGFDMPEAEVKRIVNKLKNHRSSLIWQVGNEWNYNQLYKNDGNNRAALNTVRKAGQWIKSVDKTIPMATNYGHQIDESLYKDLPDFDIWGLNIYEGKTFAQAFSKYMKISKKPLYIGEFGADAYNAITKRYDPESQAIATEALLKELDSNLSAVNKDNAAIGGTIFEWNDEWWKDKNSPGHSASKQDVGGIAPGGGPYPDLTFNEEWWGIVDIDRKPRPAYEKLKAQWKR